MALIKDFQNMGWNDQYGPPRSLAWARGQGLGCPGPAGTGRTCGICNLTMEQARATGCGMSKYAIGDSIGCCATSVAVGDDGGVPAVLKSPLVIFGIPALLFLFIAGGSVLGRRR